MSLGCAAVVLYVAVALVIRGVATNVAGSGEASNMATAGGGVMGNGTVKVAANGLKGKKEMPSERKKR